MIDEAKKIKDEYDDLYQKKRELQKKMGLSMRAANEFLAEKINSDPEKDFKVDPNDIIFSFEGWNCFASPFERCVYTHEHGMDYCIFCEEPEERK